MTGNKCAIYARYSSDLQSPLSIDDQVRAAKVYAESQGWIVAHVFQDAAISGSASLHDRPGLAEVLAAAKQRSFDILLVEGSHRLARDEELSAYARKRLKHEGIKIAAVGKGVLDGLVMSIESAMASRFLDDLATAVRRGQAGNIARGYAATQLPYGYQNVSTLEQRGQWIVCPTKSPIVRRMFAEYRDGKSHKRIAQGLNKVGIAAPGTNHKNKRGELKFANPLWSAATVASILANPVYRGDLVYGRTRTLKDPDTGKRLIRPANDPITQKHVPHLRIVEEELWQAVQKQRADRSGGRKELQRRSVHLFSGLVCCADCGGQYTIFSRDWLYCKTHQLKGECKNRRGIRTPELERRVLERVRTHLLSPQAVEIAVENAQRAHKLAIKERSGARQNLETEVSQSQRAIDNLMRLVEAGADPKEAAARLSQLAAKRNAAIEALASLDLPSNVEALPNLAATYRAMIPDLENWIADGLALGLDAAHRAQTTLRRLINRVTIVPTEGRQPVEIQVEGNILVLIGEAPTLPRRRITVA